MSQRDFLEPIEVIVHFAPNGIRPLRFLWHGHTHRIKTVRGRWTTFEGQQQSRHYAVSTLEIGNCELTFTPENLTWNIVSVSNSSQE